MYKRLHTERLRLLLVAGVAAPALMVLVGFALGYILRREVLDLFHWPTLRTLVRAAVTSGLSMGLVYALSKSHPVLEKAMKDSGVKMGEEALRTAGYPVMFVVVSAAGLAEEVLFRGGLQPSIGIIAAAVLFGVSHGGWRKEMWAYVVAASISGGLFGLAYRWTGDLWVPMIAHTLHNIVSTVLLSRSEADEEDQVLIEEAAPDVSVDEPLPAETDSEATGAEDGPPPDGEAERPL